MTSHRAFGLCALLMLAACGEATATKTCSPLTAKEEPISLTALVAAGRHTDGTVYAVDEPSKGSYRAFVSAGGELLRRRVAGAGSESSAGLVAITLIVQEPTAFALKVERPTSGSKRMGVLRGALDDKTFTIGERGDVLTVEDAAVEGLAVRNLPGGPAVEYEASTADGRRLVVIRPTDDWTYEDFRLFLGTADRMEERAIKSTVRYSDGGTTEISFVLDGSIAVAHFPSPLREGDTAYLKAGTDRQALTLTVDWTAQSQSYLCF
ncbi:MAG: hypothetical protein QM765_36160 [Myxococcales bacterium]